MNLAMHMHASLGHLHWAAVKSLLKAGAITQLSEVSNTLKGSLLSLSTLPCRACDLAKKTVRSLPRTSSSPPKRPWQLVVADHCGPFAVQYGGNTHITLFVEASTQVGFIFERNSLTGEGSADYLATIDNLARKTSNGIECFRTDEGSDTIVCYNALPWPFWWQRRVAWQTPHYLLCEVTRCTWEC